MYGIDSQAASDDDTGRAMVNNNWLLHPAAQYQTMAHGGQAVLAVGKTRVGTSGRKGSEAKPRRGKLTKPRSAKQAELANRQVRQPPPVSCLLDLPMSPSGTFLRLPGIAFQMVHIIDTL